MSYGLVAPVKGTVRQEVVQPKDLLRTWIFLLIAKPVVEVVGQVIVQEVEHLCMPVGLLPVWIFFDPQLILLQTKMFGQSKLDDHSFLSHEDDRRLLRVDVLIERMVVLAITFHRDKGHTLEAELPHLCDHIIDVGAGSEKLIVHVQSPMWFVTVCKSASGNSGRSMVTKMEAKVKTMGYYLKCFLIV